jgi:hypothetical protein
MSFCNLGFGIEQKSQIVTRQLALVGDCRTQPVGLGQGGSAHEGAGAGQVHRRNERNALHLVPQGAFAAGGPFLISPLAPRGEVGPQG